MKETQQNSPDKIENVKQVSIEKKTVHIGNLKPKNGHTLFEVNVKLKTIEAATFDNPPALKFTDAQIGVKTVAKKITVNPDCIYIPALNKKNVKKILERDFGIVF